MKREVKSEEAQKGVGLRLDNNPTQHQIQLVSGRTLTWYEWGSPAGVPVLFCTGAAMSGCMGFAAGCLSELGVRLISVDRPGLGYSTHHADKTLLSWSEDMRELLSFEGLLETPVGAVGFSQGSPFALALADAGLVQAVSLVAGQDELSHGSVRGLVAGEVRDMLDAINADPRKFEADFIDFATPEGLWDLIIGMSHPQDQSCYLEPTFAEAYRKSLQLGFRQGPQGYVRDLVVALSPWPFSVEQLVVPVDSWYGGLDTSLVHSPDNSETLVSRLVNARRFLEPNEGSSLLWTKSENILAELLARL